MDVNKLIALLAQKGIAEQAELIGVSCAERNQLESFFGVEFPKAYHRFLEQFGRSAGLLSPWMAIYFDDLKEIRELFDQLNQQRPNAFALPKNALIISNWESTFDYINCQGEEDPVVYRINLAEPDRQAAIYAESFSSYLEHMILTSDAAAIPSELALDEALVPMDDVIHY